MYDYQITCFNGANRTKDKESTDATAINPISEKCEKFIENFCKENNVVFLGGVAFGEGLLTELTTALEENNFKENWTMFSDTFTNQLKAS
jgi:tRNA A37 threonylcarbamoyltransferase TsaD